MELTIEDLINKCPACGGSGVAKEAESDQASGSSYGRQVTNVYPLTSTCQTCDGTGYLELTPLGKVFKQFVDILKRGRAR